MAGEDATDQSVRNPRRAVYLGAAVFACLLLGGLWLWKQPPSPTGEKTPAAATSLSSMGVVDVGEVLKVHNAYDTLESLHGERQRLQADLDIARQMLVTLSAPQASRIPFEDAARQKEEKAVVRLHGEFLEKLAALEKAKRNELKPAYEAARDEINAQYFNDIFNLQLKIDNAGSMQLPEEKLAAMEIEMMNLKRERGRKQWELMRKYEEQVQEYLQALAAEHGMNLEDLRQKTSEQIRAEELRRQAEAQKRNADAIQKNLLEGAKLRKRVQEKQQALSHKEQEIQAMEEAMLQEIASKAAKVAVRHHLSCVFAKFFVASHWPVSDDDPAIHPIGLVNISAMDITEELVKEMR